MFKLLRKLVFFALMMLLMGYFAKYGYRFAMKVAGVPQVSTEESELMSTVFDSAVKLVSGSAKKEDLARDLSDKLYAGRATPQEMKELGIEIVQPGASPSANPGGATPSASTATGTLPLHAAATPPPPGTKPSVDDSRKKAPSAMLGKISSRLLDDRVGMTLAATAMTGMVVARRFRRKSSKMDDLLPAILAMQNSNDADPYDMRHAVQGLTSEDFELLVAMIYQRQGYRVSMAAGQSGGRGGDFTLARKAERLLVQCKKHAGEHRVAVERVREFQEAMVTTGISRGLYVATCGFSWDARHFAKTKGITLINARTLDQLLDAAKERPEENLLAVAEWAPTFLQKVTLTPPLCPSCDAEMDEITTNGQAVWVCKQRPDCRGRRNARKRRKGTPDTLRARVVAAAKRTVLAPRAAIAIRATVVTADDAPQPAPPRAAAPPAEPAESAVSEPPAFQPLVTIRIAARLAAKGFSSLTGIGAKGTGHPFVRSVVPRKLPAPQKKPDRHGQNDFAEAPATRSAAVPASVRGASAAPPSAAAAKRAPELQPAAARAATAATRR